MRMVCPVCSREFNRPPSVLAARNRCSQRCRDAAEDEVALADFDPGPARGRHDAWVDQWRNARVELERRRP